jgi:hypothetical protein
MYIVLSCVGRGLCDGLITRPEESYRMSVCVDQETTKREAKDPFWTIKKGKAVPLHAMKVLGGRRYSSYSFSTSALDGGEWSTSRPGRAFTSGERIPGTHCTGGWVGPRSGLDTEARGKILCPRRGSNPDRPVIQPVVRHYTA